MADDNQIEIPQEEIELPSYDTTEYLAPNKSRKEAAMRDAALPFMKDQEVLAQQLEENDAKNPDALIQEGADRYEQELNTLNAGVISEASIVSPELGTEVAQAIQTENQELLTQGKDYKSAKGNILAMEGSERLSMQEIDNMAADQLVNYGLADAYDKMSFGDTATSFLGMLLVPDIAWNTSEVVSKAKENFGIEEVAGGYFDTVQDVVALGAYRRKLSAEDRLRFDKKIGEIYDEVDDNQLQKAEFFRVLMGRNDWFEIEDIAEKSAIGITIAQFGPGIFMKGLKAVQLTKRLGEAGDKQSSMKVADAVSASEEASKAAGVSQIDAANVGHPARDIFDGAPSDVSTEYRHFAQDIDDALARIDNVSGINIADMSAAEQARLAANIRKYLPKEMQIDDLTVTFDKGMPSVNFNIMDESGNVVEQVSRSYTLDDLGSFVDNGTGLGSDMLRPFVSPKYVQGTDAARLVDQAMVGTYAKAKIGADYTRAAELAFKPIKGNKESIRKVNEIMEALDGEDIKATYQLLVNEGWGGLRLTDKEFQAVTGIRKVLDDMFERNNRTLRQEMELKGQRSVDVKGEQVFAKPYESPEAAEAAFHGDPDSITIFKDGVEFRDVSLSSLEDAYKEGYTLVKSASDSFDDWFKVGKGKDAEHFRFALVKKEKVGSLPPNVLQKTPNYLPKMNKDANFFIKETRSVRVGGRMVSKPITLAYAPTRTAADKWLKNAQKMDADEGVTRTLNIHEDSMDLTLETGDIVKASGGLIRGKRAQQPLEYAGDFGGGRADTFESIQRAIGITSDRMAMSRWRMAAREEWMNTVRPHIPDLPNDWIAAREKVATAPMSASQRTKNMTAHDQVSGMSMIPTKSEQRTKGAIISAAKLLDNIDNMPAQKIASYMYSVKDKSPIDLLKSATFNLTLGTFSMVQIPVQAAGALVAISVNPVYALKAADKWLVASALDLGTDLKVVKETASILGKRMGMNKEDVKSLQNDYSFWRASGMKEAVVKGNADTASMMNGLPMDAGMLKRGFNAFVQAGQTPYRMGELANMRISFFTALERQKGMDGAKFVYDEATMQKVLTRAENFRLNMNAANKAAMQKGIWSLPTQFKQIYTKYVEAIAGREFTGPEKTRMLMAQTLVFGAAGVPILNHFSNEFLKMSGISENTDAETLTLLQRGSVGWMLNDYMGIDAAFSGRLTVSADIIEELRRLTVDGRTPMAEAFLGASATPLKNGLGFLNNLVFSGNMIFDAEKLDQATVMAAMEVSMEGLTKMSSSGRALIAARDLKYGWVRNSTGEALYQVEPEFGDMIARAAGLGSQDKEDMYKQDFINMKIDETRKATVDQIVAAQFTLSHGLNEEDGDKVKHSQIALSMINARLDTIPLEESLKIREMALNKINNPNDKMGTVISKGITTFYEDSINAYNSSIPLLRQRIEEEEATGKRILEEENR